MRKHLELVAPRDRDQCKLRQVGHPYREGGGGGNRNNHRTPAGSRLLHHLNGNAARQHDHTGAAIHAGARNRSDELVERIVPSDIFPRQEDAFSALIEAGRMHRARLGIEQLLFRKQSGCMRDLRSGERKLRRYMRRRTQRLLDAFDTAQPATDRPGHAPPPACKSFRGVRRQIDLEIDALLEIDDFDPHYGAGIGNDAFGEREAIGEVFQIGGRRHHDGMGRAIISERDRRLLGHGALSLLRAARTIGDAADGPGGGRQHIGYSAAVTSGAIRRDCLA